MATSSRRRARERRQRRQRIFMTLIVIVVVVIIAGVTCVGKIVKKYTPSKEKADLASYYNLTSDDDAFIIYDNAQLENNGKIMDEEGYIPYAIVHEYLNSRFYWDETEQILRYVTPNGIINVTPESAEYTLGDESYSAEYIIVKIEDGVMYMAMDFVGQYSNIRYEVDSAESDSVNRIVISDSAEEVTYNEVKKSTEVRELGGIKSPILTEVSDGDLVTVLEAGDTWTKVCTEDGFIGYMKESLIGDETSVLYDYAFVEDEYPHNLKDFEICMAWHQVTSQIANQYVSSVLDSTEGVNVISPTWFYLNDSEGGIASLASSDYVTYCHNQGVEVWALVSNLEDPDVDVHSVLCETSKRDALVNNLIAQALLYDLDGINVDFESLTTEDSAGYLEFIRELSLQCENNGIVISVDNYVPSAYTELYHRDEQAVFADYIILMAYDEHFGGSDTAGSVASIGFVEQGVSDTLEEVPENQLILGVPFYTRLWQEASDGTVTSEALGMDDAQSVVSSNGASKQWLDDMGQNYATYESEGYTYEIWLEDEASITEKLDVMDSYGLAGASFWKLGYDNSSIWDTIAPYFN